VDDCSTDDSYAVAKRLEGRYPGRLIVVQTPKNTGNAAGAKNYGSKFVNTELIGFVDDDSYPEKNAISNMIGFFDDFKVGAVTTEILVKNRHNFLLKLQSIEYKSIKFTRKLLEYLDSIYVTPGPLAIYRKTIFDEVGKFDEGNLTEDIELAWRIQYHRYKIKMSVQSRVYSIAPEAFKQWFKQRIRWNIGGLQTMFKYKNILFRKGTLGSFILPFYILSWSLGFIGLFIFGYRIFKTLLVNFLSTKYSLEAQTAILSLSDINLGFGTLTFFGLVIFFLGLFYTIFSLYNTNEPSYKREGFFTIAFYMVFYLFLYPIILITSLYKLILGDFKW